MFKSRDFSIKTQTIHRFSFDENLFIEMIQELEKSDGKFLYKDACELVFIGVKSEGGYDFSNFQRLDLNLLSQKEKLTQLN